MKTPAPQPDMRIVTTPTASFAVGKFAPHKYLTNGHAQTLVGNFLPRAVFPLLATEELVTVDARDNSRVLCHCHWQREKSERLTVVLVHGLEGSSDSRYMKGLALRAWREGWNVVRMNMRNCGGTEALTPTLYHSGLSDDVGAVVEAMAARHRLERFALIGYSMGGNLVLKLVGEQGARAAEWISAVVTVSPVVDLQPSADALHVGMNRIYERHFLRGLRRRYAEKAALFPHIYAADAIERVDSVRTFDEHVVSRYCGFSGADDYYYRSAAARVIEDVTVPALVLHALDDPFIRLTEETREKMLSSEAILLYESRHGGHCAFLSAESSEDIHWAERTAIRFLKERA